MAAPLWPKVQPVAMNLSAGGAGSLLSARGPAPSRLARFAHGGQHMRPLALRGCVGHQAGSPLSSLGHMPQVRLSS